jgi:replication factor A1
MTTEAIKERSIEIIGRFREKNVTLDLKTIKGELSKLVETYGMDIREAENAIVSRIAREHDIVMYTGSFDNTVAEIKSLASGAWATLEVKCIEVTKPPVQKMEYQGVFADATGAMQFTVWERKGKDAAPIPPLKSGSWYRVEKCVIDTYNGVDYIKAHSGTTITEIEDHGDLTPNFTPIASLNDPGIVSIRGKVVRLFETKSERVKCSGIIADETGSISFVAWASNTPDISVEDGQVYEFRYCTVAPNTSTKYPGNSLTLSNTVIPIDGDMDVVVGSGTETLYGNLVQVRQGSGLIKRCPVEGCNRTIDRRNFCAAHGIQAKFTYDMRIKAVIDDGCNTYSANIPCGVTEAISGVTVADAIEITNSNPLGFEDVFDLVKKAVCGRYFMFDVVKYQDSVYVTKAEPLTFEQIKDITGIPVVPYGQQKIGGE